jgi:hypothetical protein
MLKKKKNEWRTIKTKKKDEQFKKKVKFRKINSFPQPLHHPTLHVRPLQNNRLQTKITIWKSILIINLVTFTEEKKNESRMVKALQWII